MRLLFLIALSFAISACATSQEIKRPDGSAEYLVACGASTGWHICYQQANELCPSGYNTLSEDAGFNRKKLRIACPTARRSAQ